MRFCASKSQGFALIFQGKLLPQLMSVSPCVLGDPGMSQPLEGQQLPWESDRVLVLSRGAEAGPPTIPSFAGCQAEAQLCFSLRSQQCQHFAFFWLSWWWLSPMELKTQEYDINLWIRLWLSWLRISLLKDIYLTKWCIQSYSKLNFQIYLFKNLTFIQKTRPPVSIKISITEK